MTSIVDKYYRRIIQNIDNFRMKFDISALLVKSKEHDSKIENNETNISSNLTKIGNNETNISSNLTKIGDNETNISPNLTKIGDNETNISPNLTKIGDNETNISSNLTKINSIEENNLKISNNIFNDKYDIEKQLFSFNKNMHLYKLFEIDIENNFNLYGEL